MNRNLNCFIDRIWINGLNKKQYFDNLHNNPDWYQLEAKQKENWEKKLLKDPDAPGTSYKTTKKKVAQAEELWELYELYKAKMQRKNFLDFGDMITMLLDEFDKNESFIVCRDQLVLF